MNQNKDLIDFLEISRIALSLRESLPSDDLRVLNIFMNLEDVLDKCRMYTRPNNEHEQVQLQELVANMDILRNHIREIMDSQNIKELEEFMIDRGRAAQNQFSLSL